MIVIFVIKRIIAPIICPSPGFTGQWGLSSSESKTSHQSLMQGFKNRGKVNDKGNEEKKHLDKSRDNIYLSTAGLSTVGKCTL